MRCSVPGGILCVAPSGADPKGAACSTVPAWSAVLAAVCLVLFALLAVAVDQDWASVGELDEWGDGAAGRGPSTTAGSHDPLRWVEDIFGGDRR